jgi:hypothetical protein
MGGCVAMILNNKKTKSFHISILGEFGVKESWVTLSHIGPLSCVEHILSEQGRRAMYSSKSKDGGLVCFNLTTRRLKTLVLKEKCTV